MSGDVSDFEIPIELHPVCLRLQQPDQSADHGPQKQCSMKNTKGWRCGIMFSAASGFSYCEHHRLQTRKRQRTQSTRDRKRKWSAEHSDERATYRAEHKNEIREAGQKYYEKNKDAIVVKQAAYAKSPAGRAGQKKQSQKMMNRLSRSLFAMVRQTHPCPTTFRKHGLFKDEEDARSHFASTFKPWMSFQNLGKHLRDGEYNAKWNIGHRLPKSIFDETSIDDIKRCWHRRNLFAQCARQNLEYHCKLALTDDELLELKDSWPLAANDDLGKLKSLFH